MKNIDGISEFIMTPPPIPMPIIGYQYQLNGDTFECYQVQADAAYGNNPLTVTAVYRKIQENKEHEISN